MTTTAIPSSGANAAALPPSGNSTAILRRAPVLLRLPALQGASVHEPPARKRPEIETPPAAPPTEETEATTAPAPGESDHSADREPDHAHREGRSRRERKSRSPRETEKKPGLSQWVLGGCMLAAGVLGFFALSGDFGGSESDAPPDGWRQHTAAKPPASGEFVEPQFAPTPSGAAGRAPATGPEDTRNWSNPAEGEIIQTPASAAAQGVPNFIGSPGLAAPGEGNRAAPPFTTDAFPNAGTRSASLEQAESAPAPPPQNSMPNSQPGSPYPTTGASGLSPMTSPAARPQDQYPVAGSPQTSARPAITTGAVAGPGSVGGAAYPSTSTYPATDYRATGSPSAPFPNYPSATSPRYERIR